MKRFVVLSLLCLAYTLSAEDTSFPWLDTLDAGEGVRVSGLALVGLPYGMYALEPAESEAKEIVIGVHGMRSAGYEWVYPLQTMNSASRHIYFFHWDTETHRCQVGVAANLQAAITAELETHERIESVTVVGHSLGGVLVTLLADSWDAEVSLTIHTIAAPLSYLSVEGGTQCPHHLPQKRRADVRFIQWRTQFELDNAFNTLDYNPMVAAIPDSIVVELPSTYRQRRLGHNWSVSYVAERIAAAQQVD